MTTTQRDHTITLEASERDEEIGVAQRLVQRPARLPPPDLPLDPVALVAPPAALDPRGGLGGLAQVALPLMGGVGSVALFAGSRQPLLLIAGGAMLGAMLLGGIAIFVSTRTGSRRRATQTQARYLDYLEQQRKELADLADLQRAAADLRHPAPELLAALAADPARLWERRRHDPDFLVLRIGIGVAELCRPLAVPAPAGGPLTSPDPVSQAALERVVSRGRSVGQMPLAVPLSGSVSLVGEPAGTRAVLRALLTQLAVLHADEDVRLALCAGPNARADFEWVKWLPHLLDPLELDGPVARRSAARNGAELASVLQRELSRRANLVAAQRRTGSVARIAPTHAWSWSPTGRAAAPTPRSYSPKTPPRTHWAWYWSRWSNSGCTNRARSTSG